ncbi:uncharacterized protein LOC121307055 [Polyodon spathula]|uniref:uncharacterized protein LOC121307055 n=1 Tax=Polyodon spathula TaxID=7913 RepID=UPI001B7D92D7|nr:uncharacterized protein LOC121307055 [Polyodon spathula]
MAIVSSETETGKEDYVSEDGGADTPGEVPKGGPVAGEREETAAQEPDEKDSDFLPSVCLASLLLLVFILVSCLLLLTDPVAHRPALPRPRPAFVEGHLDRLRILFPGQREALWKALSSVTRGRPLRGSLVLVGWEESRNTLLRFSKNLISVLSGCSGPEAQSKIVRHRDLSLEHRLYPMSHFAIVSVVMETRENVVGGVIVELQSRKGGGAVGIETTTALLPEHLGSREEEEEFMEIGVAIAVEFLVNLNSTQQALLGGVDMTILVVEPEGLYNSGFVC